VDAPDRSECPRCASPTRSGADAGRTKLTELLRALESLDEPDVVELRDGRVGV
jgi:hypothetical protein